MPVKLDGFSLTPVWRYSLEEGTKVDLDAISRLLGDSDLVAMMLISGVTHLTETTTHLHYNIHTAYTMRHGV